MQSCMYMYRYTFIEHLDIRLHIMKVVVLPNTHVNAKREGGRCSMNCYLSTCMYVCTRMRGGCVCVCWNTDLFLFGS